jgi:hypothetical protein
MVRVVSPSDIRGVREFSRDPPEPDADAAFAPTEDAPGKPKGEPLPPPGGNESPPVFSPPDPPDEPEPAPIRPAVEYLDPAPIIYPLRYPVYIDGVGTVRELAIHGPALWDIQDWAAGRIKTNFELMARMVGIAPEALGALRWPDIEALASIVATMLPDQLRAAIEASRLQPTVDQ